MFGAYSGFWKEKEEQHTSDRQMPILENSEDAAAGHCFGVYTILKQSLESIDCRRASKSLKRHLYTLELRYAEP